MADLRIMVFDRLDRYLFDLDLEQVRDATYVEAINGEHSITITTTQQLAKTNRLLMRDGMGTWHEYVVLGIEETHDAMEYYCIWSMQYDLMGTFINGPYDCGIVPGHASVPQYPRRALEVSLGDTSRWEIGTITVTSMAAASFYRRSGWEGLKTVLEKWGGELQATITVGQSGVISRAVDLLEHVGASDATRRFDYGFDLKGIKRTISDDIWPCRIVPLGKSQQTENGGYTRRPDIGSVNNGVLWLQDDSVVEEVRILNPDGEYEYPTKIIENDTYEEPADIKAWALEHITEYTRPKVTYEADVLQFEQAGLNAHGVALGDNVVAVDRTFRSGELRIDARVTKIAGSLLDTSDMTLTIGNIAESITGQFGGLSYSLDQLTETVDRSQQWQATADYVAALIGRLNDEANATGGYTYITQGEGIRTYDVPVSDPLIGAEASQVVEVRGGTVRIANSRTQAGDWDWKSVFTSGHVAAEMITAARLTAGYIGNNEETSYWDLDTGVIFRGAEMKLLISENSLAVSSTTARGANSMTSKQGSVYLICFTCADEPPYNFNMSLSDYNNTYSTSMDVPRKVESFDDGTSRYAVIVKHTTSRESFTAYVFAYFAGGNTFGTLTLTDIRVYEYPLNNEGAILFKSAGDSERDSVETAISGGFLSVTINDNTTSLRPGSLRMNSYDSSTEIQMAGSSTGIMYDRASNTMLFGDMTTLNSSSRGKLALNITSGVLDMDASIGRYRTSNAGALADWFTFSASCTAGSGYLRVWGPIRGIKLVFSLNSSLTLTNGRWVGSVNIGKFATAHWPDTDVLLHGIYNPNGGQSAELTFTIITGTLYLRQVNAGPSVTSLSSGSTIYIQDMYLKS